MIVVSNYEKCALKLEADVIKEMKLKWNVLDMENDKLQLFAFNLNIAIERITISYYLKSMLKNKT